LRVEWDAAPKLFEKLDPHPSKIVCQSELLISFFAFQKTAKHDKKSKIF
jgi:hypothetical protein